MSTYMACTCVCNRTTGREYWCNQLVISVSNERGRNGEMIKCDGEGETIDGRVERFHSSVGAGAGLAWARGTLDRRGIGTAREGKYQSERRQDFQKSGLMIFGREGK